MKYVVMYRDECGEEQRAFGSPNLEKEWEFPAIDWDDEDQVIAFEAWRDSVEERLQKEWEDLYGEESRVFLERKFSDMSLGEWGALGYYVGPI